MRTNLCCFRYGRTSSKMFVCSTVHVWAPRKICILDQLYSSIDHHRTTANPSDHIFSKQPNSARKFIKKNWAKTCSTLSSPGPDFFKPSLPEAYAYSGFFHGGQMYIPISKWNMTEHSNAISKTNQTLPDLLKYCFTSVERLSDVDHFQIHTVFKGNPKPI